jgi:16S rRNA (uracil1498-N3)-methyltransferase
VQSVVNQPTVEKPAVHFAVGPEGGWTADEETLFTREGWQPVSLGPRILRAETAGITAMAVIAAMLG